MASRIVADFRPRAPVAPVARAIHRSVMNLLRAGLGDGGNGGGCSRDAPSRGLWFQRSEQNALGTREPTRSTVDWRPDRRIVRPRSRVWEHGYQTGQPPQRPRGW